MRTDLGAKPSADRAERRRSLLYIGHHTDVHVCDAQSPARLEGGETFGWFNPGADGGHRPQETCTTQVLDQLVVATNAVATSPLTGAPMAWCAQTGDNTDTVTLWLSSNPGGGTLSGTLTMTVSGGVATFSDLAIDTSGAGYTLHASIGGSLPDIDSNPFNIT